MTKLKTRLLKDLPIKTTPITDEDYVINSNNGTTKLKIKDITKNVENKVEILEDNLSEFSEQLDNKANNLDLEVQKARIDNLIAHNNSTDGNSELIDIRVGRNGDVYRSAGESVRNELDKLYNTALSLDVLSKNLNNENFLIDRTYIDTTNGELVKENKESWVTTFPINCSSIDFITISNYEINDIRYRTLTKDLEVLAYGKYSVGSPINVSNAFFIQVCYPVSEKGNIMIERGQNKSEHVTFKKIDVFSELEKLFDYEIKLEFKQYSGIKGDGYIWTNNVESEKDSYSTSPLIVTQGEKYRVENINRMSYFYDSNMRAIKRIEFDDDSMFEVIENAKYVVFSCYCKDIPLSKMKLYRLGSVNKEVLTFKKSIGNELDELRNDIHNTTLNLDTLSENINTIYNNILSLDVLSKNLNNENFLIDRTYIDTTNGELVKENKESWVTTFPINCSSIDFITISNYEINDIRYRTLTKDLEVLAYGKYSVGSPINVSNAFFIQVCYPVSEKGNIMIERGQNKSEHVTFKKIDVFSELEKLFDYEIKMEFKQYSGIKGDGYIWTNRVESEKDSYSTSPIIVTPGEKYRVENINRMSYFYDENMRAIKRIEFDEFSTFEVEENVKYIAFSCYCKDVALSRMKLYRLGSVNEEVLTSKKSNNIYNNSHDIVSRLYPKIEPIFAQRNNVYNIPPIGNVTNKNSILNVTDGHFLIENSNKKIGTTIKRATHCFSQPNNDFFKDPEIHYENGKYYMFATGIDANKKWEIQYATADKLDGNWTYRGTCLTREGCSPLLTNGNLWAPTLIKKDNLWYMFITDGRNSFLATSSTLNGEWTWNTNVCFMAFDGHVIHENDTYYMIRTTGSTIRYKTSKDLLNWSTDSVTMLNTNNYDWCENWTEAPFIFKHDNTYYCFYGSADSGDRQRLGVAVSSTLDGEWVDLGEINIIVPESSKNVLAHPCVLRDNGIFYLYFCGTSANKTTNIQGGAENFRMFRYKSNDLINWTPVDFETNLKPNTKELVYLNTYGELEFTTEVQNPSHYQVAYIETDSDSRVVEIKNLLPYLEGDNKVKNGYFDNNLDNWLISNNNSTNPSLYTGTILASSSTDIVQKGLDKSCVLTSNVRAYGGIKQTIKDNSFNVGDYIAIKCYLKNKNCSKVKLITNVKCRTTNEIIFSSTNELNGFDGWTPLTSIIKIPSRKDTTIYFGKYSIELLILCDIDNGQQLNISDVQVVKINKQLIN